MAPKKEKKQMKKKSRTAGQGVTQARLREVGTRLDKNAAAYLALLKDPCGADLARPLYLGTGTGYLTRYRGVFTVLAAGNTNFAVQVAPNALCSPNGHGMLQFNDAGVAGTIGQIQASSYFPQLTAVANRFRTVACCARLYYVGAESARSGRVGQAVTPNPVLRSTMGATVASTLQNNCQIMARTDPVYHEAVWVPSMDDEQWWSPDQTIIVDDSYYGSCLFFCGVGVPTGSIQIEVTWVVEWQPDTTSAGGQVTAPAAPASANTLEQVLRVAGPVVKWGLQLGSQSLPGFVSAATMAMNNLVVSNARVTGPRAPLSIAY